MEHRSLWMISLGLAGLTACGDVPADLAESSAEGVDEVSEALTAKVRMLGPIHDGQTRSATYKNPPAYRGFRFDATSGQGIDVWVRGTSRRADAVTFILGPDGGTLADNDDASNNTLDSHVTLTAPTDGEYKIVFRDYSLRDASFRVSLELEDATTCEYGGNVYVEGDSFPSTDGCNDCNCGSGGSVGCTKRACITCDPANEPNRNYVGDAETCKRIRYACGEGYEHFSNSCGCGCERPAGTCDFDGHVITVGTGFYDGCNQCTCAEGGIICTRRACMACDPQNEPTRSYLSSDVWGCNFIEFACAPGFQRFANSCGCGCEPQI